MAGENLGRYELKSEIGRGGMAVIYLAYDPRFERNVALKVLPQQFTHDPTFLRRFEREAQTLASLEHFSIVPVYDFGETDGIPYLVMRHMSGGSLRERIASGPLSLPEIVTIIERIASALNSAHEQGIIHRDIKPSNILFDSQELAYLSDFGIVKLIEQTTSFTGTAIVGTPAYMSPEQVHGDQEIDARSDIYSLGIVLYEMLTGEQPFKGNTPSKQMMAHVLEPPPRILEEKDDLPPEFDPIMRRALAKVPEDRYQSAIELATAVRSITDGEPAAALTTPSGAEPAMAGPSSGKQPPKSPIPAVLSGVPPGWLAGLVALGVLGLLVALAALLIPSLFGNGVGTPTARAGVNGEEAGPSINGDFTATGSPTVATTTRTATHTRTSTPTPESTNTMSAPTPSSTATVSAPTPRPRARVAVSSINLRSGPGANYPSKDFLFQDETVEVIARTSGDVWYQVIRPDGSSGWVSADVVDIVDDVDPASIATAVTTPTAPPRLPTNTPLPPPTSTPLPPPPPTNTPLPPPTSTPIPPPDTPTPVPPPTNTSPPPTTNP